MSTPTPVLLLSTCPDPDSARTLAHALVSQHLAACVTQIPNIASTFHWQGKVCEELETKLLIKSTTDRVEAIKQHIRLHHPYEVPELLVVPITDGLPDYLAWLVAQTRKED